MFTASQTEPPRRQSRILCTQANYWPRFITPSGSIPRRLCSITSTSRANWLRPGLSPSFSPRLVSWPSVTDLSAGGFAHRFFCHEMDPDTAPVIRAPTAKAAGERSLSPIGTATASRICCSARRIDFSTTYRTTRRGSIRPGPPASPSEMKKVVPSLPPDWGAVSHQQDTPLRQAMRDWILSGCSRR